MISGLTSFRDIGTEEEVWSRIVPKGWKPEKDDAFGFTSAHQHSFFFLYRSRVDEDFDVSTYNFGTQGFPSGFIFHIQKANPSSHHDDDHGWLVQCEE